ncbi:unnamed protein product, partial [Trypanosoma congolense IL3000]
MTSLEPLPYTRAQTPSFMALQATLPECEATYSNKAHTHSRGNKHAFNGNYGSCEKVADQCLAWRLLSHTASRTRAQWAPSHISALKVWLCSNMKSARNKWAALALSHHTHAWPHSSARCHITPLEAEFVAGACSQSQLASRIPPCYQHCTCHLS